MLRHTQQKRIVYRDRWERNCVVVNHGCHWRWKTLCRLLPSLCSGTYGYIYVENHCHISVLYVYGVVFLRKKKELENLGIIRDVLRWNDEKMYNLVVVKRHHQFCILYSITYSLVIWIRSQSLPSQVTLFASCQQEEKIIFFFYHFPFCKKNNLIIQ